jgi:hypothetical protein
VSRDGVYPVGCGGGRRSKQDWDAASPARHERGWARRRTLELSGKWSLYVHLAHGRWHESREEEEHSLSITIRSIRYPIPFANKPGCQLISLFGAVREAIVSTATSRTLRGLMSRRSPGPASRWGTPLTSRRRSLGRTDRRHCGETRKSSEFGSSDNNEGRSRLAGMNGGKTGTWQTKPALKVILEDRPLGRRFGNKLATTLAMSAQRGYDVTGRRAVT